MRDWTFLYLGGDKEPWVDLRIPAFVYERLAKLFRIGFSVNERKREIFGSVISDLPFEVFQDLRSLNLIFEWPDRNISSVKSYSLNENSKIIVALFPDSISEFGYLTQRGSIVHEIAHIIRKDYELHSTFTEREKAVDDLMRKWGFVDELKFINRGGDEGE